MKSRTDSGFFILWNPKGHTPPRVTFTTLANAEIAAERMATQFAGDTFYIMQMVGGSVVETVKTHIKIKTKGVTK